MIYNVQKIVNEYMCGVKHKFVFFWKPNNNNSCLSEGVFSQWEISTFHDNNYTYTSAEQYMMAQKALLFKDITMFDTIMQENDPDEIRKLGRLVKNFDEYIWNKNKKGIVLRASYLKFSQNENLKKYLLSTGDAVLVEASPYDNIWGIKMGVNEKGIENPDNWRGENLLGFALMEARDIIRSLES